jgi:hypothetical protein
VYVPVCVHVPSAYMPTARARVHARELCECACARPIQPAEPSTPKEHSVSLHAVRCGCCRAGVRRAVPLLTALPTESHTSWFEMIVPTAPTCPAPHEGCTSGSHARTPPHSTPPSHINSIRTHMKINIQRACVHTCARACAHTDTYTSHVAPHTISELSTVAVKPTVQHFRTS